MNKKPILGRKPKPSLIIGIDCGSLTPKDERDKTGVATVVAGLLETLAKIDKRNQYYLFNFGQIHPQLLRDFDSRVKNVKLPQIGFKKIWMPLSMKLNKPQVFLAMSQVIMDPLIPTLGFIYDLAFLKYPKLYANFTELKSNTQKLVIHSKHIITISQASKKDIIDTYHLNEDFITVAYPGIEKIFVADGGKYVDTIPYFLYVGSLKQTKNIPYILKGFAQFLTISQKSFRLVLVGSDKNMDPEIKITIKALNLHKKVIIKGYVSRHNLPKYYRGAQALVTPALYEGFGLPIAESMACGAVVIAASNSSMPEIIQNAGLLVDEKDTQSLAQAMLSISQDEKLRTKLAKLSLKQAKKFSQEKFAKTVLKSVYDYCID